LGFRFQSSGFRVKEEAESRLWGSECPERGISTSIARLVEGVRGLRFRV